MSTFDAQGNKHAAPGKPGGGQFETQAKPETEAALAVPDKHRQRYEDMAARNEERVDALWKLPGGGDPDLRHAHQVAAVAAIVKAAHPTARYIEVVESDQYGSTSGYVDAVLDDQDRPVEGEEDSYGGVLGDYEDQVNVMLSEIQETAYTAEGVIPGLAVAGNRRMGHTYRIDIDEALAVQPVPDDFDEPHAVVARAVKRGQSVLDHYRAHHDEIDLEPAPLVKDLLTDLAHTAREQGLDVDYLFGGAITQADEEQRGL